MPAKKRSGRRAWPEVYRKAFALRLYAILCERYGTQAPFERLKAELARLKTKTRESTIRGWLPPLERLREAPDGSAVRARDWSALRTPDLAPLVEISRVLDVSIDYLLGAGVPRRLTDRVPLENPAPSLSAHVARDYLRRTARQRRDGLAAVMGGRLTDREPTPDHPDDLAEDASRRAEAITKKRPFVSPQRPFRDWPQVGDTLPDGRLVTNRSAFGLQLLDVDAKAFLAAVCDRVFADAEKWEEEHKEAERVIVRQHVADLLPQAVDIAKAMKEGTGKPTTEADVLRELADASQNPLDSRAQMRVLSMRGQLNAYRHRRERDREFVRELSGLDEEILNEIVEPEDTSPPVERALPKQPRRKKSDR